MVETTPLLRESRSPPADDASPLSRYYAETSTASRRDGNRRGGRRIEDGYRMHPSPPSHYSSRQFSSTQTSSSSPRHLTTTSPRRSSSSSPPSSNTTIPAANQIWQIVVSLPYRILCFASPTCSPLCGICCCFTCISASEYGVMQRFGKFDRFLHPGMHFMKWPMEREAGRISTRIKQLDVDCETKSKDHVFIRVHVSIQYQTNSTHLFESYYSLSSPTRQLTSHVHDMIRSTMPLLDLDDIFSAQDTISYDFHRYLNGIMNPHGFLVHHALITRILPNEHVRRSMNEIQASKRTKEAMPHRAEAVRISTVKEAEAGAKRAHLIGIGVARERGEIARGMRDAVDGIVGGVGGGGVSVSAKGAMDLLLLTQYYDVLTDLGRPRWGREGDDGGECREESHGGTTSTSLFLMHTPDVVSRLSETARECFGSTNTVGDAVRVENLLDL